MKSQATCLVVDDDPMFVVVATSVLATLTAGRIITANNGQSGVAALSAGDVIDFVFLDLNMPDLDGLAFLRAASELGFAGHVVISSGESRAILQSAQILGRMLGISIVGTLSKPLQLNEVKAILEFEKVVRRPTGSQSNELILENEGYDLTPYYQAQYDVASGELCGFEALIRLRTTDGQIHGPSKLFDSLKDATQLTDVSLQIYARVLQDVKGWRLRGLNQVVSVNFDASVLEQPECVNAIMTDLADARIDPKSICLEVTEKSMPRNPSRLIESLARLRMSGFHLALDDYGTGASNFELLRQCPFSELKFDRSIIASSVQDGITRRFMTSSATLAHDLDMVTVAEGVENRMEFGVVLQAEISRVQGFMFSRPEPEADARAQISQCSSEAQMVQSSARMRTQWGMRS